MPKLNHKGLSMLEAIASVFIITLVLTTAISIIISVRNNTIATNERIVATQVGSQIRDSIVSSSTYDIISPWMNSEEREIKSTNCASSPFGCSPFEFEANNKLYDTNVTIFLQDPDTYQSDTYQYIRFTVTIIYYSSRTVVLEGIIYE
jgi:Tfp pilus assembly protein PilV